MRKASWRLGELQFLAAPPLFWLMIFFVAPLLIILAYSFSHRGMYGGVIPGFTLEHYRMAMDPLYFAVMWRSVVYASATTLITLLIAFPMAYYMACASPRHQRLVMFLVVLPFWTNLLIRLYSFMVILGGNGLVNALLLATGMRDTPAALMNNSFSVLTGLVYCNLPYMVLPLFAALDRMDVSLIEASMDMGANRVKTFLHVTLPQSIPGIAAGVVFCFVPTLGNFLVPDLLGGPDSMMIGNVITVQFQQGRNWPLGSALASVLIFAMMVIVASYLRFGDPTRKSVRI